MSGSIGREAVLGGRRYWEGGGIGREAVLGGLYHYPRYLCYAVIGPVSLRSSGQR